MVKVLVQGEGKPGGAAGLLPKAALLLPCLGGGAGERLPVKPGTPAAVVTA